MGKDYAAGIYKEFKFSRKKVEEYRDFVIAKLLDLLEKGEPIHLDFEFLEQFSESSNRMAKADEQYWTERQASEGISASETTPEKIDFFGPDLPILPKYVYTSELLPARAWNKPYFKIMAFFLNQFSKSFKSRTMIKDCDCQIHQQLAEYMASTYNLNTKLSIESKMNIQGCFVVSSDFEAEVMKATYEKVYPGITWHTQEDVPQEKQPTKMIFAVLPYAAKTANVEKIIQRHEIPPEDDGEYSDYDGERIRWHKIPRGNEEECDYYDEEIERYTEELEIDYEKLKELLQECNSHDNCPYIERGGFLALRSLEHEYCDEYEETKIAEVDRARLLRIIEEAGWSLVLVGNSFTDFFVLHKPTQEEKKEPPSPFFVFLKNFEAVNRETQLMHILKACWEKQDYREQDKEFVHILEKVDLLRCADFNVLIAEKKERELKETKERQGFRQIRGRDCIESIDYYDLESDLPWDEEENAVYLPKNNKLFPLIGICYSASEICKKFCNQHIAFKDLELKGLPWFDYCQEHEAKYFKDIDRLKDAKLIDWEDLQDDWQFEYEEFGECPDFLCHNLIAMPSYPPVPYAKYDLAFLFAQHDLSIPPESMDKAYKDGVYIYDEKKNTYLLRWRIHRNDYEKGYTTFQLLVSQMIRANVVRVVLHPQTLWVEYLKLYWQTELGQRTLKQWKECLEGAPLDNFKELEFVFPNISVQKNIVHNCQLYDRNLRIYQEQQTACEKDKTSVLDYIGGAAPVYLSPQDIGKRMDKKGPDDLFRKLPQPLASIFYLSQCEQEKARTVKNWLNFFEAAAIFHAMTVSSILLILLKDKPAEREKAARIIVQPLKRKGDGAQEAEHEFNQVSKMTFGTWTTMLELITTNFGKELDAVFDHNLNEELIEKLNEGRENFRNAGSAHGPRPTEPKDENMCDACRALAGEICQIWVSLYGGTEILYDCRVQEMDEKEATFSGFEVIGAHPRLRYVTHGHINKEDIVDEGNYSGCFYIWLRREMDKRLIRLLPFVCYRPLTDEDPRLLSAYYLNEIVIAQKNRKNSYTMWRSLDCGDKGLRKMKFDEEPLEYYEKQPKFDQQQLPFDDKTTRRVLDMTGEKI